MRLAIAVYYWPRYRVLDPLVARALDLRIFDLRVAPAPGGEVFWRFRARYGDYGVFGFLHLAYRSSRRREGMGLGDAQIASVAWFDWLFCRSPAASRR